MKCRPALWLSLGVALVLLLVAILLPSCATASHQDRLLRENAIGPAVAGATVAGGDRDVGIYGWVEGGYTSDQVHNNNGGGRGGIAAYGGRANLDDVLTQSTRRTKTELWIVPTDSEKPATQQMLPIPGGPVLVAKQADGKMIPIPLKHTDVAASITGYIASVGVTQQYQNPYAEKIEAVYVFPLSENAAVNEFIMTIGDRHIRGIVRERQEAEQLYKEAKAQGYTASLMTQERPNIFTQSVANIEPGKQIDIEIRYFHTLTYNDGWFQFVFPMVVGPRYNPAGSTNGVGAVARNDRGSSGQRTEIQYLRPEERSGHDISLSVDLDAGVTIEELTSVNHKIQRRDGRNHHVLISLDPADTLPNKDFVLRYRVAGDRVKSALFVQKDKEGSGYFTLLLVPPQSLANLPRRPVEMVFVVDTSGSMNGRPEAQARSAVNIALDNMNPDDTFQVVQFNSNASQMSPVPLPANKEAIAAAHRYVAAMEGNNGTEMLKGMNAALDFPHDPHRTRVVAFLTDGYIGNEIEILRALHEKLVDSRVFSFGVGSSPNRYLLDGMARLGNGNADYLPLDTDAQPIMQAYFDHISHPALAQIQLDFGGTKVHDVYPSRIPELFVGRPVIIAGRYDGSPPSHVMVRGAAGREAIAYTVALDAAEGAPAAEHPAIASVWARAKIADLNDEAIFGEREVAAEVKTVALQYGLISEYTAFLAVDSSHKTEGDHGTTVAVPVPVPEGVRYDTTVHEPAAPQE